MRTIICSLLVFGALSACGQDVRIDSRHRLTSLNCNMIDAGHGEELAKLSLEVKKANFDELCSVRKGKGRFQLLSKDGKGGSKEIVCVVVGDEGNGIFLRLGLTETKKKPDDQ
ncbi:hypothetical protein ACQ86N_31605 [Puia sp. P3]|uniref:hypothetical protein n=1 Tax=Puia sp. P3 TaxID=3423952 RepID=UPI003D67D35F